MSDLCNGAPMANNPAQARRILAAAGVLGWMNLEQTQIVPGPFTFYSTQDTNVPDPPQDIAGTGSQARWRTDNNLGNLGDGYPFTVPSGFMPANAKFILLLAGIRLVLRPLTLAGAEAPALTAAIRSANLRHAPPGVTAWNMSLSTSAVVLPYGSAVGSDPAALSLSAFGAAPCVVGEPRRIPPRWVDMETDVLTINVDHDPANLRAELQVWGAAFSKATADAAGLGRERDTSGAAQPADAGIDQAIGQVAAEQGASYPADALSTIPGLSGGQFTGAMLAQLAPLGALRDVNAIASRLR